LSSKKATNELQNTLEQEINADEERKSRLDYSADGAHDDKAHTADAAAPVSRRIVPHRTRAVRFALSELGESTSVIVRSDAPGRLRSGRDFLIRR
jgi:hypothetical protein